MVLSKIERIRDKHLYNLYFDGQPLLRIHEEVLVKFGLRTGDSIGEETFDTLKSSEEFVLAKREALAILNRRARSEKELRDRLRNKEYHPRIISLVVTHLNEQGLLDDKQFARIFTRHILSRKPAGKALLQRELRLKGISQSLTKDILNETLQEQSEEELALAAVTKLLNRRPMTKQAHDGKGDKQRLISYLSRRGFSWQTIHSVMRKLASPTPDFPE